MGHKVNFHVTGHGQLNGNLRIDKNVEMDNDLANRLRVDKKALLKYVETQYPGAKVSENSLSVRLIPIQQEKATNDIKQKQTDRPQEKIKDEKIKSERQKNQIESKKYQNEIDQENLQHKIKAKSLKIELDKIRLQNRQTKIDELKASYSGRPKNFQYYLKLSWTYLDTGLKKVVAIFVIWYIIAAIYMGIAELFKN